MPPPREIPGYFYDPVKNRYFLCPPNHNASSLPPRVARLRVSATVPARRVASRRVLPRISMTKLMLHRQLGVVSPTAEKTMVAAMLCRKLKGAQQPPDVTLSLYPHFANRVGGLIRPYVLCENADSALDYTFFSVNCCPFVVRRNEPHASPREACLRTLPNAFSHAPRASALQKMAWKPRSADGSTHGTGTYCCVSVGGRNRNVHRFEIVDVGAAPQMTPQAGEPWSAVGHTMVRTLSDILIDLAWHSHDSVIFAATHRSVEELCPTAAATPRPLVSRSPERLSCLRHLAHDSLLCVAYAKGHLCLLDRRAREPRVSALRRRAGAPLYISDFRFLADERQLVVASYGNRLELWDRRAGCGSGNVVHEYEGHVNDGEQGMNMAVHGAALVAAHGTDDVVRIWDINRSAPLASISVFGDDAQRAAASTTTVCFPQWSSSHPGGTVSFLACSEVPPTGLAFRMFSPRC